MIKKKEVVPGDEIMLMRQIYDNLQFLDYEKEFDPVSHKLPPLTPFYFAIPQKSTKEQFDYFSSLCIWMMQDYLGSSIETPSDYDQPASITDNIISNLPSLGFKINFSPTKHIAGFGLAVCSFFGNDDF